MNWDLFSLEFLFFFALLFLAYYGIGRRFQWQLLLLTSLTFYAVNNRWEYSFVLASIIGLAFFLTIQIGSATSVSIRRLLLVISIVINVSILLFFKYLHLFQEPLISNNTPLFTAGAIAMPLGLSYMIFKVISYAVDVYRKRIRAEARLGVFALYLSFFLEVSSGPIDRAKALLPQVSSLKSFSYDRAISGLRLILWGLFKKFAIANNLALYVNPVFESPQSYNGITLIVATYFLAFQLYADFSGYTDMVRGAAQLLGYELPQNFATPYLSKSISEFWTRWHITLSTWLRDYLFLPLSNALSRRIKAESLSFVQSDVAIYSSSAIVTFLIAGVWHGSAWTFVVWGLLHGLFLAFSSMTRKPRKLLRRTLINKLGAKKLLPVIQTVICFHLVAFSWIFFRASSIDDSLYIIENVFSLPSDLSTVIQDVANPFENRNLGYTKYLFAISTLLVILFCVAELMNKGREIPKILDHERSVIRWSAYLILFFSLLIFGEFGSKSFIYVQF